MTALLEMGLLLLSAPVWVSPKAGIDVGEPVTVADHADQVALAAIAEGYVALLGRGGCAAVQLLSVTGQRRGERQRLACSPTAIDPAIAVAGEAVVIVWEDEPGVVGAVLDRDLTVRHRFTHQLGGRPTSVSVAHDGTAFVVVAAVEHRVAVFRVDRLGKISAEQASVTGRRPALNAAGAGVACARSSCAIYFRERHDPPPTRKGQWQRHSPTFVYHGVRFEDGGVTTELAEQRHMLEVALVGWGDRLYALFAAGGGVWGRDPMSPEASPFRYQTESPRRAQVSMPSIAAGDAGLLMTWLMEPERYGEARTAVVFVHPDPTAAQPSPFAVEHVGRSAIGTHDGRAYILLTASPRGPVQTRTITVDPTAFAKAAAARPPAATGVVHNANGAPVIGAWVHYWMRLRNGTSRISRVQTDAGGHFAAGHPIRNDLQVSADVTHMLVWAEHGDQVSEVLEGPDHNLTLRLRPADPAAMAEVSMRVTDPAGSPWPERLIAVVAPGERGATIHSIAPGKTAELDDVWPGEHTVVLLRRTGEDQTLTTHYAPGFFGYTILETEVPTAGVEKIRVRRGTRNVIHSFYPVPDAAGVVERLKPEQLAHALVAPSAAEQAAVRLAAPLAGEVLIEAAPVVEQLSNPEFDLFIVGVPELTPGFVQARVTSERTVMRAGGAFLKAVLQGPRAEIRSELDYRFYNHIDGTIYPSRGPAPPRHVSPPVLEIAGADLRMAGLYRLTLMERGKPVGQAAFRVVGATLAMTYDKHRRRTVGDYLLAARAAYEAEPAPGPISAFIHRGIFVAGKKKLVVDVLEPRGETKDRWLAEYLTSGSWSAAPRRKIGEHQIAIKKTGRAFEVGWVTRKYVVRVTGERLGRAERELVEHYLRALPPRRPR